MKMFGLVVTFYFYIDIRFLLCYNKHKWAFLMLAPADEISAVPRVANLGDFLLYLYSAFLKINNSDMQLESLKCLLDFLVKKSENANIT